MALDSLSTKGEERPPKRSPGRPSERVELGAPESFRRSSPLPNELATVLERGIVLGEYAPGTRFVEEEVAARFDVSRSPVREAFRQLEAQGLVVREVRRGVRVTLTSIKDLDEVYSCRRELEGLAAQNAAELSGPAEHAELEIKFNQLCEARDSGDLVRYFDANLSFTGQIYACSGNMTLVRILQGLAQRSLRYRFLAYRKVPHMVDISLELNRELVDAIMKRRPIVAREVARLLVLKPWVAIREVVQTKGV